MADHARFGGARAPALLVLLALAAVEPGCGCNRSIIPVSPVIMVSPAGAPAGATVELTVRGTVIDSEPLTSFGAGTTMLFDGVPVPVEVQDAALLTATVSIPSERAPGTVLVEVYGAVAGSPDPLTTPFNVLDPGLVGTISMSPAFAFAGTDTPLDVMGENVTFVPGVTTVDFDSDLVTITDAVVVTSPTTLALRALPDASLPNGFVTLTVFNGEEFVAQGAWAIVNPLLQASIEVMPNRAPRGARDFPLDIAGVDIDFDQVTTMVELSAPGVTVRSLNVSRVPGMMSVSIDVAPEAALGDGILLVRNGPVKAFAPFIVDDRLVPGVASTTGAVVPGATVNVPIVTAAFALDSVTTMIEVTAGAGIEGATLTVGGSTTGLLDATIARGTPAGFVAFALHDVFTEERVLGALPVASAGAPEIAAVTPAALPPGGGGTYTLSGAGTGFVAGVTTVEIVPLGLAIPGEVTPAGLVVSGPLAATVDLTAIAAATQGPAIVRLVTGTEVAEGLVLVGAGPGAGLVPAELAQGRTVVAELVADGIDLTSPLASVTSLAPDGDGDALPDVAVVLFAPLSPGRARVTLHASDAAALGMVQLLLDDGGTPLLATLLVEPGTPSLSVPTVSLRPGDVLEDVSVVGHFTSFAADTVAAVPGLIPGLYVERTITSAQVATVKMTAALDVLPGDYPLVIGTGAEAVATTLTVEPITILPLALAPPGMDAVFPGSLNPGAGASAAYWAFSADAGSVVTFTADATLSTLDPTLRLYGSDGVTILAENLDLDPTITLSAQVTWAFETTGIYYLRLEAGTAAGGAFSLRARVLDAPRAEAEPNDDAPSATDLLADPLVDALIVRGDLGMGDVDYYRFDVTVETPGDPLAQIVIDTAARALVDQLGAVPDLMIEILMADGSPLMTPAAADDRAVPSGHFYDPTVVFAPPASGTYLVEVSSYAGTRGPYLLNLRGPLVINEIFYNPQGASGAGTFLELSGVAGLATSDMTLEVKAYDCAGLVDPVAGLDAGIAGWSGVLFPADGLYVFGSDATVAMFDLLVPVTAVDFSEADGTRIDLIVTPAGGTARVIDSVHFASAPASCAGGEAGFAPNPPDGADTSIGRAFGFDGDDNTRDFRTQLRPSSGERNVTDH